MSVNNENEEEDQAGLATNSSKYFPLLQLSTVFLTCTIIIEAQQDSQDHSIEFNDYEESKEASADNEVDKEDDVGLAINCF